MAQFKAGSSRLFSRNGNDITATFPELSDPIIGVLEGRDAILDGEIVALDGKGRPSFARLQRRMHVLRPTTALRADVPVTSTCSMSSLSTTTPRRRCRTALESLGFSGPRIQLPPYWTGNRR
ncbi:hypothetical protein R4P64_33415 [Rhodococcus sp. IEGM 1366]|uniref:ATP-dependent DNA ligase n=1 Tax=Rhodococcus sp. IEGM 1366 TaxID=3082223 RepID=UPI002952AF08|nr:hypothetical protein [Rhodococcus sp. IEGM 1366]MDV8071413.1 hypothetical protein [Rhodococcus sp. IEGM 1366]